MSELSGLVYKVLLVDDRKEVLDQRVKSLLPGVKVEVIGDVDKVLKRVFGIDDATKANFEDYPKHEYDIVLLDFELEPPDQLGQGKHPLGGMTLFPLFANSFSTEKIGQCVVVNYSDKLDKAIRLQTLKCLMEVGHSMQHGRSLRVRQTGFKDFNLVPLIKERARSILISLPREVLAEIRSAINECKSFEELLDEKELIFLGACLGCRMTLGALRPDVGRPSFVKEIPAREYMPNRQITDDERDDLTCWLNDLLQSANWCYVISKLYSLGDVKDKAHIPALVVPNDFWGKAVYVDEMKRTAKVTARGMDNKERTIYIPIEVGEGLRALHWDDGYSRCGNWHAFFRLCLNDDHSHRIELSGYPKGYFLKDIEKEIGGVFRNEFSDLKESLYMYVPAPVFYKLMTAFVGQVGKEKEIYVELSPDKRWVQFIRDNSTNIKKEFLMDLAVKQYWDFLPTLQEWGHLFALDCNGGPWCIAPGRRLEVLWTGIWKDRKNVFAMRFPLERK